MATKNKDDKKNSNKTIVLKVYMHCEGCSKDVSNCLKRLTGVEEVKIDIEENKVTVMGEKADPLKILAQVQKKFSRNAELISAPKPKPQSQKKAPEKKQEQSPQVKTAVLKTLLHCEGCARDIKKSIERMPGILSVQADMAKSVVTVCGDIEAPKLAEKISKQMRKHVQLVKEDKENNKNNKNNNNNNNKKVEENMFHYPTQYALNNAYLCQVFSDENVHSCSLM